MNELTNKLNDVERVSLSNCEIVIKTGLQTFFEVGNALAIIRDKELYRETYKTFDEYCQEKWQLSLRHSERLMQSFSVIENLRPIGRVPENEGQTRELSKLSPDEQQHVWQKVLEISQLLNKPITAKLIKQEVDNFKEPEVKTIEVIKEVEVIKDPELINKIKALENKLEDLENKENTFKEQGDQLLEISNKYSQEASEKRALKTKYEKVKKEITETKKELAELKKSESKLKETDVEREEVMKKIAELKIQQSDLLSDSDNLDKINRAITDGIKIFQDQLFIIPALELNTNTKKLMRPRINEIIEMVDKWKEALEDKFFSNENTLLRIGG